MPTIDVHLKDFEALIGRSVDADRLDRLLLRVKGEVKAFDRNRDAVKIEFADSNRPDLWSVEGVARQIRICAADHDARPVYPFFDLPTQRQIIVAPEIAAVRPWLAACTVDGMVVTDAILAQMIQAQEKLADLFGQKRKRVSIGLYRLSKIDFPVRYELADPDQTRFIPLGFNEPMSLADILARHPKGIAHADTLKGAACYPILRDAAGSILSFPPIINSREIGEVQVGDDALLVEVTGDHLQMVLLALNIFACNLADRSGRIGSVEVCYPTETPLGKTIRTPYNFVAPVPVEMAAIERCLGEAIPAEEAAMWLVRYGHAVEAKGTTLVVTPPPYRDDLLHSVDVIEDVAMSRGYDTFLPKMPETFTVGSLDAVEQFCDRVRDLLVGLGFQEVMSNVLASREEMFERMVGVTETSAVEKLDRVAVEIDNPMTDRYTLLRPSLLPSLMRVEGASAGATYPHHIFEIGEVAQTSDNRHCADTRLHLAAAFSAPTNADFSTLQVWLENLATGLGMSIRLSPTTHPTFIDGRVGEIRLLPEETPIGLIGEIHPEVLTRWQITMPTVAFEIALDPVIRAASR